MCVYLGSALCDHVPFSCSKTQSAPIAWIFLTVVIKIYLIVYQRENSDYPNDDHNLQGVPPHQLGIRLKIPHERADMWLEPFHGRHLSLALKNNMIRCPTNDKGRTHDQLGLVTALSGPSAIFPPARGNHQDLDGDKDFDDGNDHDDDGDGEGYHMGRISSLSK